MDCTLDIGVFTYVKVRLVHTYLPNEAIVN